MPKANREYWVLKVTRNKQRDKEHAAALNSQGWQIMTVWECEIVELEDLTSRLTKFLEQPVPV